MKNMADYQIVYPVWAGDTHLKCTCGDPTTTSGVAWCPVHSNQVGWVQLIATEKGWECPRCGSINATVKRCDCRRP